MTEKDNTDSSKIYDMYFQQESFTQRRLRRIYETQKNIMSFEHAMKIYVLFDHRYGGCRPIKPIVYSIFVRTYS